ncbi:MAG: hypothetical protein LIP08_04050 [Bacteroides sp.]|nr:hypothetical protein [Bacteroides sp.]
MKRVLLWTGCMIFLCSCGNQTEKQAGEKLKLAEEAYAREDFDEALRQLDSIKILYPRAFDTRKAGNELEMQVKLKDLGQRIAAMDMQLEEKQHTLEEMRGKYVLEKDEAYQQTGNYLWPTQVLEKNLHRCYLRFQVNERGAMSMTSLYCGKGNIHHHSIKVSAPDDTFAQTPPARDSYQTTDLDEKIEKADFKLGEDGGVMEFIYANRDKNIRIEYIGDRSFRTNMLPADRKALAGIYELHQLLASMETLKKEKEEAELEVKFINERIRRKAEESTTE